MKGKHESLRADEFEKVLGKESEKERYRTMLNVLVEYRDLFHDKAVLDFGASFGTSTAALLNLGAKNVVGVEPDLGRVNLGCELLNKVGLSDRAKLFHLSDTSSLPFKDAEFEFILANAVLEHIPQPRESYISELWRVLDKGGHLIINETPNKYFPKEMHTTGLWFNHWLPRVTARRRAVRLGRFDPQRMDWSSSGWRGLGYFELISALGNYQLIPENSKIRHRLLTSLGVPASLFDPYPSWVLRKM